MRTFVSLVFGLPVIFLAHVTLPYLYVGSCHTGAIPNCFCSLTSTIDPAMWMIFLPFLLAWICYNYVFCNCGISGLASRRLLRWPISFVLAFLSLWLELIWIFNTFGS